jgi:hypothetical protein
MLLPNRKNSTISFPFWNQDVFLGFLVEWGNGSLETGIWKLETGKWKLVSGVWCLENRKWEMVSEVRILLFEL